MQMLLLRWKLFFRSKRVRFVRRLSVVFDADGRRPVGSCSLFVGVERRSRREKGSFLPSCTVCDDRNDSLRRHARLSVGRARSAGNTLDLRKREREAVPKPDATATLESVTKRDRRGQRGGSTKELIFGSSCRVMSTIWQGDRDTDRMGRSWRRLSSKSLRSSRKCFS